MFSGPALTPSSKLVLFDFRSVQPEIQQSSKRGFDVYQIVFPYFFPFLQQL